MSYRIPGGHPVQKPTRSARIDWHHPLSTQLVGAWLVPEVSVLTPDHADAWHYRIPNGVDDNYARVEGYDSFSVGPRGAVVNFFTGTNPICAAWIPNAPAMNYGTPMSLFVRARIPTLGSFRWLVSKVGGSWLGMDTSNKLCFTTSAGVDRLSATTVGDGGWHTVGMTLLGTTLQLYVDGVADNSFTSVTLGTTSTDTFWGHRGDWAEVFNGDIEWVYQWKRALTVADVALLQADPFAVYQNNPLSRYYALGGNNLSATGDRVTTAAVEVAYPGTAPANKARLTLEPVEVGYVLHPPDNLTAYGGTGASGLIGLLYAPGMPTGPTWAAAYSDPFGTPALETLTYTPLNLNTALVIDGDGIPPTGNVTYDQTPSLTFNITQETGVGPYLYRWSLTLNGTGLSTGAVVATNQITLPVLAPSSGYVISVTAVNASGGSATITPYSFAVLARRPPPAAPFGELPPFDLEPVDRFAADYLRYLPRWMSVHGTATAPPSGALLFRVLTPMVGELHQIAESGQNVANQVALSLVPLNLPRLAWRLQSKLQAVDAPVLSVRASGDVRGIRRAISEYDFFTADEPVYLLGGTGQLLLRNLAMREVTTTAVATGGAGATQYQMPAEGQGMVPDANVLFQQNGVWQRIRGGSVAIDPYQARVQLPASMSGSTTFRYQSLSYTGVLQIAVSGQPWTSPGALDLWNRFDEIGLLGALERRPGEDNVAFRNRLTTRLAAPPGNRVETVRLAIAADLALTQVLGWDGLARLDLGASGYVGIRAVLVPELAPIASWSGLLYRDGDRRYFAPQRDWLPGWQVRVDGRPATRLSYPGIVSSGFVVDFGQPVSGQVTASYRFSHWTTEVTNGFVTAVVPTSGNVVSGHYQVLLSQNVQLFAPADPGYQAAALLNADGTPNQYFLELRERLLTHSPVHFTRARWGDAYWFTSEEQQPQLSHLPVPLDRFVDSGSRPT